jgi:MerR family transcriptional regulator, copper efflux regulator
MDNGMHIGELAKEAGVGVETIRFYERERLLRRPKRTSGNYRLYDVGALGRLKFILNAKNLGFSLDEIRVLLRASENPDSDAGDFRDLARRKIEWIDERVEKLREMRETLAGAMAACPGHGHEKSECPVLALLTGDACCKAESCSCGKCMADKGKTRRNM